MRPQTLVNRALICSLFAAALCATVRAGDETPAWLRQAASAPSPTNLRNIPAVVLLTEQSVKIEEDGRAITTERYAVRILTAEGRDDAVAAVHYIKDAGKMREMRAWLIRPSKEIKRYGKDKIIEIAAAPNDVFDEGRVCLISGKDDAEPGAIFGAEWTTEARSVFTQFEWQFQERLPTLASRFTIALPAGWRADGITFNHAKIEPAVTGDTYLWELRDLAGIEDEPASPPVTTLAPREAVSYFPASGKGGLGRSFDKWVDVSRWLTELSDPQAGLDDALASKARQLTAGATTEMERIQAIGRYVQAVKYISIQTGVGRGGGYRPHAATDVFAKAYGDCKDKANLMRAMLKAINIPAHLVSIFSGDPSYVRAEWPSPQQFNHCIIAVRVSDDTQAPTVVKHPTLGRLLIFDPTDDNTPVGDLPEHEQGSLALIVAGDAGALLKMPVTPPEANRLERQADVDLQPDGSISVAVHERTIGQSAVSERAEYRRLSRPDYVKLIERWITRGATGASVSKVESSDASAEGRFALDVNFTAARYGQLMQGRLLVFKPAIVSRRESLFLTGSSRKHPVILPAHAYSETVKIKLPEGFAVDEMPDPAKLETSFGSYSTNYVVKDGQLYFTRTLVVQGSTIPVSDYAKVRTFFERVRAAEQSPVVLAKK